MMSPIEVLMLLRCEQVLTNQHFIEMWFHDSLSDVFYVLLNVISPILPYLLGYKTDFFPSKTIPKILKRI